MHGPVLDPEHLVADVRFPRREPVFEVAPDHSGDDAFLAQPGRVERFDGLAVAQDRDGVGDRGDLAKFVRDDHTGDAVVAQFAQQPEQMRRIVVVERRGRLVENEQFDALGQSFGDLDQLLFAHAEFAHRRDGVLPQADPAQQVGGLVIGPVPVDPAALGPLVAQEDVLGDRKLRAQREFLVDDHDPAAFAVADGPERAGLTVEGDLAVVAAVRVDAGQDLHQSGFPGAVLAADGVDLPAPHRERDVGQRGDAGEGLGDPAHAEQFGHFSWPAV